MSELRGFEKEQYQLGSDIFTDLLGDQPLNHADEKSSDVKSPCSVEEEELLKSMDQFLFEYPLRNQKCSGPQTQTKTPFDSSLFHSQEKENSQTSPQIEISFSKSYQLQQNIKQNSQDPKISQKSITKSNRRKSKMEKLIFKQVCIKGSTKKFAISKFLARMFFKHRSSYPSEQEVEIYNSQLEEEFHRTRKIKFNMEKDIARIFGQKDGGVKSSVNSANRKILGCILNSKMKEEIILNAFTEQNRLSYMIGSKVYALRTRSMELVKKASFR